MFWKYNTSSSSQIEALLGKEDLTLQEILDADDIINECRVQNKNLIDFLLKPEVIDELVTLTTREPSIEIEEKSRFKYPNVASELLTCDVPALNERLASDETLLDKLYQFIDCEPPLNPLLASYFSKIMGALIARKTEQVLDFLKAKDNFISLLLKHLGTSAIMDLMLKLMTQVEGVEMRQNILNWLDSQMIMQSLVSLLNPKVDRERHFNVAQLLCDFIRTARDNQRNSTERADPDPLLNTIESPETVSLLLDQILGEEKSETAIIGGIQVLLALLDVYQTGIPRFNSYNMYNSNINDEAMDVEQKQKVILSTTEVIATRIKDFQDILLHPPKQSSCQGSRASVVRQFLDFQQDAILTTVGLLDPPLGNTRLQVTKLFAAVISSNNVKVLEELVALGTLQVLLDLFFQYPWNNFLHTQVENCLIYALKAQSTEENDDKTNALCKHLLDNCKLIERIIKAWKENDEQQANKKNIRQGYMGHLISIVNKLVELCSSTSLGQYLKDSVPESAKNLEEFKETTLSETNKIQETLLGGTHPNVSIEENDDYGNIPFPQSNALQQQLFTQYQMQHLSAQYIDGYSGFNDDAFNDGDDTLQTMDQPSDVNFDLSEGDHVQQDELFKQVCAQNINTLFDSDDQIFEDKDHTFQTVIEKQGGNKNETAYSSGSSEEEGEDESMDVDPWTSPKPTKPVVSPLDLPWDNTSDVSQFSQNAGWADFSAAKFLESTCNEESKDTETSTIGDDLKIESTEKDTNEEGKSKMLHSVEKPVTADTDTVPERDSNVVATENVVLPIGSADMESESSLVSKSAAGDQGDKTLDEKKEVVSSAHSVTSLEVHISQAQPTTEKDTPDKDKV